CAGAEAPPSTLPVAIVLFDRGSSLGCRRLKPPRFATLQIGADRARARLIGRVDGTQVEAHGLEQIVAELLAAVLVELDLLRVGGDSPKNVSLAQLEIWIRRAKLTPRQIEHTRARRHGLVGPIPCRGHRGFGLAHDPAATPRGDGDIAR